MTHVQPASLSEPVLSSNGEQAVGELRALEESRICGLLSEDEYTLQRSGKLKELTRPTPGIWITALLGAPLIGVPAGALIWILTQDQRYTFALAVLTGAWGILSLGRAIQEKCSELCSRSRRKILVALLDNDLLTANEFAEYEQQLSHDT